MFPWEKRKLSFKQDNPSKSHNKVCLPLSELHELQIDSSNEADILCFVLQGSYYAYCHEVERNIKNLWNQEMKRNPERMEIFSTSAMPVDEKDVLMRVSTNSSKSMVSGEGKDSLLSGAADRATASHRSMHSSHSKGCDTVVFPTLQMKSFNVDYDTVSQGC